MILSRSGQAMIIVVGTSARRVRQHPQEPMLSPGA